ncbi:DUF4974 domain-containing protein [Bacteroides sp. OttesenSCG-928-D19]|nr:DUF4974 domain-containing protein [Bacteroides sp. OttesenSCG-928-D19]
MKNSIFDRIRLHPEIEKEAENMRTDILTDIHRRMEKERRFVPRYKWIAVAASLIALIGIAGLAIYQSGFNRLDNNFITLSNPPGTRTQVCLPDGSSVMLQGGSTLQYPEEFKGRNRHVKLTGEAFFDVVKDEKKPFKVKSGRVNVQVYGTTFNVEAYDEDELVNVTLQTGRIGLSVDEFEGEIMMIPNQQIVYNKTTHAIKKRTVNASEVSGWTTGHLFFDSVSLKEIATKIERYYNVTIVFASPELEGIVYTGEFDDNEPLENNLDFLFMDGRLKYQKDGSRITIYQ